MAFCLTLSVRAPTAAPLATVIWNSMPGVPSVDLTLCSLLMEMSLGPEIERVCVPVKPVPKIRMVALVPRATAPPTFEADIVDAFVGFTPSNWTLKAEAVFGTTMSIPPVACPFATVTTCGVVRLPPGFDVGGGEGTVGVGTVVVVLEEPPPQPIQQTVKSTTGSNPMRMM